MMNSSTSCDSEWLSVVDPASNPTSQAPPNSTKAHRSQTDEGDNTSNNNNIKTDEEHNTKQETVAQEGEISIIGLIVEHDADATSEDICFDISMGIERFHQSEIIFEDNDDACNHDEDLDDIATDVPVDFEVPLQGGEDENYNATRSAPSCSVLLRQAQSRSSSDLTDESDPEDPGMMHGGNRRSLLTRNKANSVAAIKCCTTRRAFSDHDAVILSNINEDDEEDGTNDDFEMSLTLMSMDHQRRYTGSSSSHYSYSNRRRSNDSSYASAYSTRGRRRSSMASTQSGSTASGGRAARRRASRRMSTECHDSLILDELSAMADITVRRDQAKDKCDSNCSANTIATAASSASTFRRPSLLASAIENNDFYQQQPVTNEDLYAYDGSCILTKLNRSMTRDWDMTGNCPLKDQARRRKNRRSTMA